MEMRGKGGEVRWKDEGERISATVPEDGYLPSVRSLTASSSPALDTLQ